MLLIFNHIIINIYLQVVQIDGESMKVAIAITRRSFKQILALFQLDLSDLPLPDKTDCGKVILSGGYKIFRNIIVQKKIAKLSANETQRVFKVHIYFYYH